MLVIPTDPARMDRWLIAQASPEDAPAADSYLTRQAQRATLERLLVRLPRFDRDILDLRYRRGKTVCDIAAIFGFSQPGMTYRLTSARGKLAFLAGWTGTELTREEIELALHGQLDVRTVRMLALYIETGSRTTVANSFGLHRSQVGRQIRHARCQIARLPPTADRTRVHNALHELLLAGHSDLFGSRRSRR